jgi:hypothetical protein
LAEIIEACRAVEAIRRPPFEEIVIILNDVLSR